MLDNNNNNDIFIDEDQLPGNMASESDTKIKPHIIRRNIEDYLEQKALEKRLQDVFDDDFLLD